jgi:hypothetical protein
MNKPDYIYIRAWGRLLDSQEYFIAAEVLEARRDKAPENAIFKSSGVWTTLDQVKVATIDKLEDFAREIREEFNAISYIIVKGDINKGFEFIGPFTSVEGANEFADDIQLYPGYIVVELQNPSKLIID